MSSCASLPDASPRRGPLPTATVPSTATSRHPPPALLPPTTTNPAPSSPRPHRFPDPIPAVAPVTSGRRPSRPTTLLPRRLPPSAPSTQTWRDWKPNFRSPALVPPTVPATAPALPLRHFETGRGAPTARAVSVAAPPTATTAPRNCPPAGPNTKPTPSRRNPVWPRPTPRWTWRPGWRIDRRRVSRGSLSRGRTITILAPMPARAPKTTSRDACPPSSLLPIAIPP
mmetsp:Transcript_1172/g.2643  ORF Transcript_1172/g.2643 Transcript_1172/m.2643 type:complete len:227 (-) Transcript_1172:986-1666(-)